MVVVADEACKRCVRDGMLVCGVCVDASPSNNARNGFNASSPNRRHESIDWLIDCITRWSGAAGWQSQCDIGKAGALRHRMVGPHTASARRHRILRCVMMSEPVWNACCPLAGVLCAPPKRPLMVERAFPATKQANQSIVNARGGFRRLSHTSPNPLHYFTPPQQHTQEEGSRALLQF